MKPYLLLLLLSIIGLQVVFAQQSVEPEIYSMVVPDVQPEPLNMKEVQRAVDYPKFARDRRIQGHRRSYIDR